MNQNGELGQPHALGRAALFAVAFAFVVTAVGWVIAAKSSPFNHGVSPDAHDRPVLLLWVVANLPAAILFVNVFSKLGSEPQYFFCVFLQWLMIGVPFGFAASMLKRKKVA
jgi:hypothetical protein